VEDPIVHGFIEHSGTVGISGFTLTASTGGVSPENNTAQWYSVSSALGCGGPETEIPATVCCLRTKDWQSVLAAAPPDFPPTIDNKLIFDDYEARAASGSFVKKPYLMGNTDYEIGNFQIVIPFTPLQAEEAELLGFDCPARDAAKARADAGVPIWRYRWFGVFPNTILTYNPPSGAWHGSELTVVFGSTEQVTGAPNTLPEQAITAYLMSAWTSFAKNPCTGLSSYPYGWPVYSPSTSSLIRLAYNNETIPSYVSASVYDSGCASVGDP